MNEKTEKKHVGTNWLAGHSSCNLIIPKELATRYGLDQPCHILYEPRPDGILVRRLEVH